MVRKIDFGKVMYMCALKEHMDIFRKRNIPLNSNKIWNYGNCDSK